MPDLKAYLHTQVNFVYTQAAITALLEKYGIGEIRHTQAGNDIILEFNYPDKRSKIKLGVRFKLTFPPTDNDKKKQQMRNQYYRALYYVLKSKLGAVEFGIREFGQEFLGDLIWTLPNGRSSTVSEIICPQMAKVLLEGKSSGLLMIE